MTRKLLYAVVCGAGPASQAEKLIQLALERNLDVQVIATPSALDFIDTSRLELLTGNPVRSRHRRVGEPRLRQADAIVVAPATYNTINKLALGISDTYALDVLSEAIGIGLPMAILPFVNSALASRRPFKSSLGVLEREGVRVLIGGEDFAPHPPGTGDQQIGLFPWYRPLDALLLVKAKTK